MNLHRLGPSRPTDRVQQLVDQLLGPAGFDLCPRGRSRADDAKLLSAAFRPKKKRKPASKRTGHVESTRGS